MKHKQTTTVALRRRRMKSGAISLYLDIYNAGRRSYEYLNLYLTGGTSRTDKESDRQTLALAEAIKAKRLVELRNGRWGFENENIATNTLFLDYFRIVADRRNWSGSNLRNWISCIRDIRAYEHRDITIAEVDKRWLEGYKSSLLSRMKQSSAFAYFSKVRCCLRNAVEDGLIDRNPCDSVPNIPRSQAERPYLTIEELRRLTATPCNRDNVRRPFLFACLTGLRRSDVERLTWEEVSQNGEFTRITFAQKKTKGLMYLDISPEASALMGERSAGLVFKDMMCVANTNLHLKRWALDAGIRKNISFHTARHTFATMMLTVGVDLYTTSKLLGHTNVATTQIYAKIVDKSKQDAVKKLPSILKADE